MSNSLNLFAKLAQKLTPNVRIGMDGDNDIDNLSNGQTHRGGRQVQCQRCAKLGFPDEANCHEGSSTRRKHILKHILADLDLDLSKDSHPWLRKSYRRMLASCFPELGSCGGPAAKVQKVQGLDLDEVARILTSPNRTGAGFTSATLSGVDTGLSAAGVNVQTDQCLDIEMCPSERSAKSWLFEASHSSKGSNYRLSDSSSPHKLEPEPKEYTVPALNTTTDCYSFTPTNADANGNSRRKSREQTIAEIVQWVISNSRPLTIDHAAVSPVTERKTLLSPGAISNLSFVSSSGRGSPNPGHHSRSCATSLHCAKCGETVERKYFVRHIFLRHIAAAAVQCPLCEFADTFDYEPVRRHLVLTHPGRGLAPVDRRLQFEQQLKDWKRDCFPQLLVQCRQT